MNSPVHATASRRAGMLAAGVLLSALVQAVPAEARTTGRIVITGSRSASATVRLTRTVTFDAQSWTATARTGFSGFYFAPQGAGTGAGALRVHDHVYGALPNYTVPVGRNLAAGRVRLPAGTYRLFLFASGRTTVTLPVEGLTGTLTLQPASPAKVTTYATDMTPRPVPGTATPGPGVAQTEVSMPARGFVVLATHLKVHAGVNDAAHVVGACLYPAEPPGRCTDDAQDIYGYQAFEQAGTALDRTVSSVYDYVAYYAPGSVPAGRYLAVFDGNSAAYVEQMRAFALRLDLG